MRRLPDLPREHWLWFATLAFGLGVAGVMGTGVCLDLVASIRDPYGLDYGEGIVWQQAALIPGPRMYGTGQGLPFIVFHYPPVFFLLTRVAGSFMPDLLSAGRLVSAVATVAIAPLVAALVLVASHGPRTKRPAAYILVAVFAGVLAFTLPVVRTWGLLMRVDMLAEALGLGGVLVASLADGRPRGTVVALLLCVAAVFCKQTQLPAGIAVFLVTLLRHPRIGAGAAAAALAVGLSALGLLQWLTMGGFLQNIIGYNMNRFAVANAWTVFGSVVISFPVMLVALAAAGILAWRLRPFLPLPALQRRLTDRAAAAQAMVLLHYCFASLLLVTVFKSGGSSNYLIDWLCIGCVLIGVWLYRCAATVRNLSMALLLSLPVLVMPYRQLPNRLPQSELDQQSALVRRIAEADKPVGSEDMVLLMRAGKPVIYEPAIVTELSALGHWDEAPLVQMIDSGGFAFMITSDNGPGATDRRSPGVDAAMRRALPRMEPAGRGFWLHLPN